MIRVALRLLLLALLPAAGWSWPRALVLEFVTDDEVLVHQLCARAPRAGTPPELLATALAAQNRIWQLPDVRYGVRHGDWTPAAAGPSGFPGDQEAQAFVSAVRTTPEYQAYRTQAVAWRDACAAQWNADFPRASRFIARQSGLVIHGAYRVLVLHPAFAAAQNLRNHAILWGGHQDWPHCTTISMWHELLHDSVPPDDLGHVLIQLLTEVALRRELDPETPLRAYVGHERLRPLTARVLPRWEAYRRHPTNILELHAELATKLALPATQPAAGELVPGR